MRKNLIIRTCFCPCQDYLGILKKFDFKHPITYTPTMNSIIFGMERVARLYDKNIDNLLKNSGLPCPRGNLSLLHSFAKNATESGINECLSFYKDNLSNSPEEFVAMCGIVGFCILNKNDIKGTLETMGRENVCDSCESYYTNP